MSEKICCGGGYPDGATQTVCEGCPDWKQPDASGLCAPRLPEIQGDALTGASGVNRGVEEGKIDYLLVRDGPMYRRWAAHMTAAIPKRGRRNWLLARTEDDMERFKRGAARHFEQWLDGETDEDHAAALFFNVNGVEHLRGGTDERD